MLSLRSKLVEEPIVYVKGVKVHMPDSSARQDLQNTYAELSTERLLGLLTEGGLEEEAHKLIVVELESRGVTAPPRRVRSFDEPELDFVESLGVDVLSWIAHSVGMVVGVLLGFFVGFGIETSLKILRGLEPPSEDLHFVVILCSLPFGFWLGHKLANAATELVTRSKHHPDQMK
jgi:hypothetical protein